ncbi:MAG: methylenetetrahydrofolate reductase [Opitutales bacterium]
MSTRISIELVPRKLDKLTEESQALSAQFPSLDTVNIPDLKRMSLRSWDACSPLKAFFNSAIPHIRAWDFDIEGEAEALSNAVEPFDEVLVITGDPDPKNPIERSPDHCLKTISKIRDKFPGKRVFAGLDPYRSGMQDEFKYVKEKIDAGACGLFSQPFFSIDLLRAYRDLLPEDIDIFWGVSPVMSEKSKAYWIDVNRALFPRDFEFSVEGNQRLAREILAEVRKNEDSIYFMPIRMDANEYLGGILSHG